LITVRNSVLAFFVRLVAAAWLLTSFESLARSLSAVAGPGPAPAVLAVLAGAEKTSKAVDAAAARQAIRTVGLIMSAFHRRAVTASLSEQSVAQVLTVRAQARAVKYGKPHVIDGR
jgi:hypothetical protein